MLDNEKYEKLVDMFASDGWKLFLEEAANLEDALTKGAVDAADSNDKWQYARGQIHQLRSILGYENFLTQLRKQEEEDMRLELFTKETDPDVDSI